MGRLYIDLILQSVYRSYIHTNHIIGIFMLSILNQWNRWGSATLKSGHTRTLTANIIRFIHTPDIIVLTGLRRAGKTTLLYQIIDELERQQIPQTAILHMNFEEPALAPMMDLDLLDEIYQTYRNEIYPQGTAYLFFDEIQNVPQWERWVRARNENEDIKIFITGSSAHLMSRQLGTLLTGRHISFHVSPLSFTEFLQFKQIEQPKKLMPIVAPPEIQHALNEYLQWGGLPEIVLSKDLERRRLLLKQYFDDLLFKDVAMRHQIRDVTVLRNLAVHLLSHTSDLISYHRLANLFGISLEMTSNYCHYLQEAFIIDFIPFYSLKVAERNRHPKKVHACDLGIRHVASFTHSPDSGKLIETLVYQHLQRQFRDDIFYWKGKQEIDFVLRKGNTISSMIQVAYDNLSDPLIWQREIDALEEASQQFKHAKPMLIAGKLPKSHQQPLVPLWYFLLTDKDIP